MDDVTMWSLIFGVLIILLVAFGIKVVIKILDLIFDIWS